MAINKESGIWLNCHHYVGVVGVNYFSRRT